MRLNVGCDMSLEAERPSAVVAILRPRSGPAQWIESERYLVEPQQRAVEYVDDAGNLCQRFTLPSGSSRICVEATVDTEEHVAVAPEARLTEVQDLPESALVYLLPSRYCPSDKLGKRATTIVGDTKAGYSQVEAIRAWIHENIRYEYGVSDASTDAIDTLRDGAGVCRDFAHIGISMCRALCIPARFVVGYLYQLDPMDMHAWFEAFIGGRWYTFDATQEVPRGGRVVIAYGRDAVDVALISEYGPVSTTEMKVWVKRA